jgi:hypothetical protein
MPGKSVVDVTAMTRALTGFDGQVLTESADQVKAILTSGRNVGQPEALPEPVAAILYMPMSGLLLDYGKTGGNAGACGGKFDIPRIRGEEILHNFAPSPDFQETRFSVVRSVDEGCQARNSLLKPFGSLPNALSFPNSLRKLRLALRRVPAHSLQFDQSNVAHSKHTVS